VGSSNIHIRAGDRECYALVHADRPIKNYAVLGVGGGSVQKPIAIAHAFRGNRYALHVHPVENVTESVTLFPNQAFGRYFQSVKEQFVRMVIHHGANRTNLETTSDRSAKVH